MVATDERRLAAHGLPLSAIRGVVPLDGAGYDLTVEAPLAISQGGMLGLWYRDAFGGDPAGWADASPLSHVAPGKAIPPFLLVHGTIDFVVPALHSERFHEKLVAAGVKAELICVPGAGHGWGGEAAAKTLESAIKFLDAELKAGKKGNAP